MHSTFFQPVVSTNHTLRWMVIACFFVSSLGTVNAQETEEVSNVPQLRGAVVMGYSHIPHAFEGTKTVAIIPSWGLDLDYVFHPKWAVALQTDIKLQSFEVEDKDQVVLVRNYPISFAVVGAYKVLPRWRLFFGPGIEYEQSRSLWIFKLGAEYAFEISEEFEIGVGLMYENRQDLYDGWTFGVSFNRRLWAKKKE